MQAMVIFYVSEFALCHNSKRLLMVHLKTTLMQRRCWVLRYIPYVHCPYLSNDVLSIPDEIAI
ncbi:hypothetical protein EA14781_013_00100 [Escherichia albertii NBRC 107761 = DSM 17582]|nr:hypothetical protein EAPG_04030 [Escherichia albertii B156]GAL52821.1 hypothetical protein EA14781_013_00100 [Escherichia albertii NBRC 107761 = DSM 17582]